MTILEALMEGLQLTDHERESVRGIYSARNNQLRLLHYPPVSTEVMDADSLARLPAHTDWSTFTLLFQDSCGGLEFANRDDGSFMHAVPDRDKLYLNVGDMLMRLSNGP